MRAQKASLAGIVQRLPAVTIEEVGELPDTARGAGGFGHTGLR